MGISSRPRKEQDMILSEIKKYLMKHKLATLGDL